MVTLGLNEICCKGQYLPKRSNSYWFIQYYKILYVIEKKMTTVQKEWQRIVIILNDNFLKEKGSLTWKNIYMI